MKNQKLIAIIFIIVLSSFCSSSLSESLPVDFAKIDWNINKTDFLNLLGDTPFEEYAHKDSSSTIVIDAFFYSQQSECWLNFSPNGSLLCVEITPDFEEYVLSPVATLTFVSSHLGMPIFIDDTYEKVTNHNSYYSYQIALWKTEETIFIYSNDDELYYYLDDGNLEFDFIYHSPRITMYSVINESEVFNKFGFILSNETINMF